jgi:hypothetical protein
MQTKKIITREIVNTRIAPSREPQFLFLLSLFAFLELFLSGVVTLLISSDPKNAVIFGLSFQRLLMVGWIWILAIIVLIAGIRARQKKMSLDSVWFVNKERNLRRTLYGISFALIVWGWLSFFCPSYLFGRQIYIFERIQPFSIALGASLAQAWFVFLYARGRLRFYVPGKPAIKKYYRPTMLFAVVVIGLGILIAVTKFGLTAALIYSNVPGIPLSGVQIFFILLMVGLWIAFVPKQEQARPLIMILKRYRLIPILIFLTTVLVWGFTPLLRHFFSLEPAAPSYQPFPYSDARFHDLGGISILRGYGIYFHRSFDKPLYMVLLAIFHSFAGFDYKVMTWLQVLFLALIPVILFLLGTKFHSPAFGVFLSLVLIIRQRNAIVLSYKVSSVNPKLFMSEEITLLGIVLFAYLVFLWMRNRKIWLAILCGGCVGAVSLCRFNSLLLFPFIACLVVPAFWGEGKKFLFKHLSVFTLAFLILLIPWAISSITPEGKPWLLLKMHDIFDQRYGRIDSSNRLYLNSNLGGMGLAAIVVDGKSVPAITSNSFKNQSTYDFVRNDTFQDIHGKLFNGGADSDGTVYRMLYHLFHNFSTSALSLPDSVVYDDLNHMSQRTYWIDSGGWDGNLPAVQTALVFLNLILVAIGLGYSWVHYRWAGMIPITIFAAYSVSISVVMNSGGRYLVPIDWVLYFYYGVAIVGIIQFVISVLTGNGQNQLVCPGLGSVKQSRDRRNIGLSLAGVICLASLIPIANFVLPAVTASAKDQINMEVIRERIPEFESPGVSIIYGEILYPYYKDDTLTFNLLTPVGGENYTIVRPLEMNIKLSSGEHAFIALRNNDQGDPEVEAIYLWQDADTKLIWKKQP